MFPHAPTVIRRKQLNKLVVATLSHTEYQLRATQLYEVIKEKQPTVFREEKVRSFRGFVKAINSFPEVVYDGSGPGSYTLKKKI